MIYNVGDSSFDILVSRGMSISSKDEVYTFLRDSDFRIRTIAAQNIQLDYATQESFEKAVEMLHANDAIQRELGAYILGQLGTPQMPFAAQSMPILVRAFDDPNDDVVSSALSAIGHLATYTKKITDEKLIDKLIQFTKHTNPDIRISALTALASCEAASSVMNAIKECLHDSNSDVVEWAEVSLEAIRD